MKQRTWTTGACCALLVCLFGMVPAFADPVIDGDITDLIAFGETGKRVCFIDVADTGVPTHNDAKIQPCPPIVGNTYVNGFDITRVVSVYVPATRKLFLGIRVAGVIGDVDGDGNSDTACGASCTNPNGCNIFDGAGISDLNGDAYTWNFNTDCVLPEADAVVRVRGNTPSDVLLLGLPGAVVTAVGIAGPTGQELEVQIDNVDLEPPFAMQGKAGSNDDGLSEDATNFGQCGPPDLDLQIVKTADDNSLCPGQVVTFTIELTNTGDAALDVDLVDQLPANLSYVAASATSDCGVGKPTVVDGTITWPQFNLGLDQTCRFEFEALPGTECLGERTNLATATGHYSHPCVEGGIDQTVLRTDDEVLTCERTLCSITGETQLCPGGTTELCGPEGNFTYLWSTTETTRCITVGVGDYTLVVTDKVTGCASEACNHTITEFVRPLCSITGETQVCPGGTTQLCGPAPETDFTYLWSTGETTRCITVGAGDYTLVTTAIATGCQSLPCNHTIEEFARPLCSITGETQVCFGGTTQLCGPAPETDFTYLWSTGETTRCITVGSGDYTLVTTAIATGCQSLPCNHTIEEFAQPLCSITGETQVCPGGTTQLCGPAPETDFTYLWSTGETTRCITVGSGDYTLVTTNIATGCQSLPCNHSIEEVSRPLCSITGETQVCLGGTTQICGPGPEKNFTYLWSTGETTRCITAGSGDYTLVTTNIATGCQSLPCNHSIEEFVRPLCSISGETQVCSGGTTQICGPNPETDFTYAWSTGATTRCITVGPGDYTLVVTAIATGCPSLPCEYTIEELSRPLCSISGETQVCPVGTTELCGPGPETDYTYAWSTGETTRCITVGEGTYTLTITDVATQCVSQTCSHTISGCGLCRITGGGCLNEPPGEDQRGHKRNTFGGNASPAHAGGGPTGNEWQHVRRDGGTILFNFHSHDAHVVECSVVPPGPCSPPARNTRADFEGTGKFSIGPGGRDQDGNFQAFIIDHREGSCPGTGDRDYYSIIVREGLVIGAGATVFSIAGEIDCGNLQIHEITPGVPVTSRPAGDVPLSALAEGNEGPEALGDMDLYRAVPNPFSSTTAYRYRVADGSDQQVDVSVYDVAGRLVRQLASGRSASGFHTVQWDGRNDAGVGVSAGIYFLRSRVGEHEVHTIRLLRLKQ